MCTLGWLHQPQGVWEAAEHIEMDTCVMCVCGYMSVCLFNATRHDIVLQCSL
jgi:hypothetical protein